MSIVLLIGCKDVIVKVYFVIFLFFIIGFIKILFFIFFLLFNMKVFNWFELEVFFLIIFVKY